MKNLFKKLLNIILCLNPLQLFFYLKNRYFKTSAAEDFAKLDKNLKQLTKLLEKEFKSINKYWAVYTYISFAISLVCAQYLWRYFHYVEVYLTTVFVFIVSHIYIKSLKREIYAGIDRKRISLKIDSLITERRLDYFSTIYLWNIITQVSFFGMIISIDLDSNAVSFLLNMYIVFGIISIFQLFPLPRKLSILTLENNRVKSDKQETVKDWPKLKKHTCRSCGIVMRIWQSEDELIIGTCMNNSCPERGINYPVLNKVDFNCSMDIV